MWFQPISRVKKMELLIVIVLSIFTVIGVERFFNIEFKKYVLALFTSIVVIGYYTLIAG